MGIDGIERGMVEERGTSVYSHYKNNIFRGTRVGMLPVCM
jgi:hypothetical protein